MRSISLDEIRKVAKFVNEFTDGAFHNAPFNRPGDSKGWRFHEGTTQKQWFGAEGGRSLYSGYMIGFALEWARLSGKAIPAETRELFNSVECRFSRRYDTLGRSEMDNGRVVASQRWWDRNVLTVTNQEGNDFNVVLHRGETYGDRALTLWRVRVYDTRYDHSEFGQFTGGSAFVTTLLGIDGCGPGLGCDGWVLDCGVDAWRLSGSNALRIREWLARAVETAGYSLNGVTA